MTTKESRRETNHAYYIKNQKKWKMYKRAAVTEIGTGNLGAHMRTNEAQERRAIDAEIMRLGLHFYHNVK